MFPLLYRICSEVVTKEQFPAVPGTVKLHAVEEEASPKEFKAAAGDLSTFCNVTHSIKAWPMLESMESV